MIWEGALAGSVNRKQVITDSHGSNDTNRAVAKEIEKHMLCKWPRGVIVTPYTPVDASLRLRRSRMLTRLVDYTAGEFAIIYCQSSNHVNTASCSCSSHTEETCLEQSSPTKAASSLRYCTAFFFVYGGTNKTECPCRLRSPPVDRNCRSVAPFYRLRPV